MGSDHESDGSDRNAGSERNVFRRAEGASGEAQRDENSLNASGAKLTRACVTRTVNGTGQSHVYAHGLSVFMQLAGGGKPDMPQIFIAPCEVAFWCEGTWGHPKDAPTPLYSGGVTFAVGRGRKVP